MYYRDSVGNDTAQPGNTEQGSRAAIPWEIIERTCIAGMTFMDAAKQFEVKEDTIRKRARRYKWPVSKAIAKVVQRAVQNEEVAERAAQDWLAKGEAHRTVVFEKAHGAIVKAKMSPPKSWKEFELADKAARRAADLENDEAAQHISLIQLNDAINDYELPIEAHSVPNESGSEAVEATVLPDHPALK
jgi:hypothetical protein